MTRGIEKKNERDENSTEITVQCPDIVNRSINTWLSQSLKIGGFNYFFLQKNWKNKCRADKPAEIMKRISLVQQLATFNNPGTA